MGRINIDRKWMSRILIILGALCIAGLVGYELVTYPWAAGKSDGTEVTSSELPDPTMPPFDFKYATPRPVSVKEKPFGIEATFVSFDEEITNVSDTGNVALGIVKIGRINVSEWIWIGSEDEQLKEGVGFVEGTAYPNEAGNVVLSGHRSSRNKEPFKYLDLVEIGDYITVKFWENNYNYQVYDSFIVKKDELWIMEDIPEEENTLTLITCDPLIWAGRRPNRLVVRARLVDITEVTTGE